jgi:hypothetical protein
VPTPSLWQDTRTFFPLFQAELANRSIETVCVVGASDGKFVVPLARRGYRVTAIERDRRALDGGPVELPGYVPGQMLGLRSRLEREGVVRNVEIIEGDLLTLDALPRCDGVWTSCSWHYSVNHHRPLGQFIQRMQDLCTEDGLFGAEFMLPVTKRHETIEHYLEEGEIHRYLPGWRLLWEAYTPQFTEAPHVEQLEPHLHRMGLVLAERATNSEGNHG